jgi:hypothetical protein
MYVPSFWWMACSVPFIFMLITNYTTNYVRTQHWMVDLRLSIIDRLYSNTFKPCLSVSYTVCSTSFKVGRILLYDEANRNRIERSGRKSMSSLLKRVRLWVLECSKILCEPALLVSETTDIFILSVWNARRLLSLTLWFIIVGWKRVEVVLWWSMIVRFAVLLTMLFEEI